MVNGVKDIIGARCEQSPGILRREKLFNRQNFSRRIDVMQPCRHCLHLALANCAGERMDLPVNVGQADIIKVHERDPSDAGPPESFSGIAADAADPADHDVFSGEG